jgi:poly(3-hydroxybutyrate) depolymerase
MEKFSRTIQLDGDRGLLRALAPGFYEDVRFTADGVERSCAICIPKEFRVNRDGVRFGMICADGVVSPGRNGMPFVNRCNTFAELGILVVYPNPQARLFEKAACPNIPGGMCKYKEDQQDDLLSIQFLVLRCFQAWHITRWYGGGLSAGAQFIAVLSGHFKFDAVLLVAGAWVGTEPAPLPDTGAVVIYGEEDTMFPGKGVKGSWGEWVLSKFLLTRRAQHWASPALQMVAYAKANGLSAVPPPREETKAYWCYRYQGASVPLVRYVLRHPYGGHNWPGRNTGPGYESPASFKIDKKGREVWPHGKPAPRDVFDTVHIFAKETGMYELVPERTGTAA